MITVGMSITLLGNVMHVERSEIKNNLMYLQKHFDRENSTLQMYKWIFYQQIITTDLFMRSNWYTIECQTNQFPFEEVRFSDLLRILSN